MNKKIEWQSILNIITANACTHELDNTGKSSPIPNHKLISNAAMASAIENSALQVRDEFGRFSLATDGGIEDSKSKAYALQALGKHIEITQPIGPEELPDDHPAIANSALYLFGWPTDELPDFANSNHDIQKAQVVQPTLSIANEWKKNARLIAQDIRESKPDLSVDKIAAKTKVEMDLRHSKGESGMSGRGGKIPSADTIKRHALTRIKS